MGVKQGMEVLIVSGSPRQKSLTLRFSNYLKGRFEKEALVSGVAVVDFFENDFPSLRQGRLNPQQLSSFQTRLVKAWNQADLIIFCLPEYNWTVSGEVTAMMDHLSHSSFSFLFQDKFFACVGTSSGRGGRLPALDFGRVLSKVIAFQNSFSMVSPKIFEAHEIAKNLPEEGHEKAHPVFEETLQNFIWYTLEAARRWVGQKNLV